MDEGIRKARAMAVGLTVKSSGWSVIEGIGREALRAVQLEALECEDDAKVLRLQHAAKGAQDFFSRWMNELEVAQNPELAAPIDSFVTVTLD